MTQAASWRIEFDSDAAKELRSLGSAEQTRVLRYLREKIATPDDPRSFGKALTGELKGLWHYRVGDVRIIASIQDHAIIVLVLRIGQRVYI